MTNHPNRSTKIIGCDGGRDLIIREGAEGWLRITRINDTQTYRGLNGFWSRDEALHEFARFQREGMGYQRYPNFS